jgi:hypothetical protein
MNDATRRDLEASIAAGREEYSRLLESALWLDSAFPDVSHADKYLLAWQKRGEFMKVEALLQHLALDWDAEPPTSLLRSTDGSV